MQHYTEILSDFVFGLKYGDLPRETVKNTKKLILDWYSSSFAGMRVNGEFNALVKEVCLGGAVNRGASVLLDDDGRYSETDAAFMNAIYCHGADMDDGNRLSMGHIAASVISAVFAVAESEGRKRGRFFCGGEIITAIVAGYEIFNRVAAAAQPGLVKRGFHSTGTAGGMASAAAVAKLLGLESAGIYRAVSLAALQSSGLIIIAESGQSAKPLNPANAARTGLLSARMAERGVSAPLYPLESEKGWLHAMTDEVDESKLTEGLGVRFTVDEGYMKPYPSCRHTHAPIECAIMIRRALEGVYGDIPFDGIGSVKVRIYENAIRIAGQIAVPKSAEDTKFSIQYAVAYTLINGGFGLEALRTEAVTETVVRLAERVRLIPAPEMEQREKGIRGASMEIMMLDGKRISETVTVPKGDAESPFTEEDALLKLKGCSEGVIPRDGALRLAKWVDDFEDVTLESVNGILKF